jgi:Predicted dehydrogenases and related proteins
MKKINAAIVGAGWVTRHCYLPHLGPNSPLDIVKVYDVDSERSERVAAALSNSSPALNADECLDSSVQAVVICTPTHAHLPLLTRCLEEGKYVLCEKPVLRDHEGIERIEKLPLAAQRLMGSATTRLRRDVRQLLSWVQAGRIGALQRIKLSWCRGSGVPTAESWRTDPLVSPTGVLEDLGPHMLDIASALLPFDVASRRESIVSSLQCRYGTAGRVAEWFGESASVRPSYKVPDYARAKIDFPGGLVMELEVCWVSDDDGDASSVVLEGTEGVAVLDGLFGFSTSRRGPRQFCELKLRDGATEVVEFVPGPQEQQDAFGKSLEIFAQFCAGEATPVAKLEEVLTVAHLLTAIRQDSLMFQAGCGEGSSPVLSLPQLPIV